MQLTVPFQAAHQLLSQGRDHLLGAAQALGPGSLLEVLEELFGGEDADVGQDEGLFQLVPGLLVELAPAPQPGQLAGQQRPGLAQPVPEPGLFQDLGLGPALPVTGTGTGASVSG